MANNDKAADSKWHPFAYIWNRAKQIGKNAENVASKAGSWNVKDLQKLLAAGGDINGLLRDFTRDAIGNSPYEVELQARLSNLHARLNEVYAIVPAAQKGSLTATLQPFLKSLISEIPNAATQTYLNGLGDYVREHTANKSPVLGLWTDVVGEHKDVSQFGFPVTVETPDATDPPTSAPDEPPAADHPTSSSSELDPPAVMPPVAEDGSESSEKNPPPPTPPAEESVKDIMEHLTEGSLVSTGSWSIGPEEATRSPAFPLSPESDEVVEPTGEAKKGGEDLKPTNTVWSDVLDDMVRLGL